MLLWIATNVSGRLYASVVATSRLRGPGRPWRSACDPKRTQTGQNGTKRSQTIPNGPIRPDTNPNEPKRPDGSLCKTLSHRHLCDPRTRLASLRCRHAGSRIRNPIHLSNSRDFGARGRRGIHVIRGHCLCRAVGRMRRPRAACLPLPPSVPFARAEPSVEGKRHPPTPGRHSGYFFRDRLVTLPGRGRFCARKTVDWAKGSGTFSPGCNSLVGTKGRVGIGCGSNASGKGS